MAQQEQCASPGDAWARVKSRLRAELGEDVFASWFRGVELERVDGRVRPPHGGDALPAQLAQIALLRFRLETFARPSGPRSIASNSRVRQPHFGDRASEGNAAAETVALPSCSSRSRAAAHAAADLAMAASRARRSIQGSLSRASWSAPRTGSRTPQRRRSRAPSQRRSRCSTPLRARQCRLGQNPSAAPSPGT